MSVSIRTYSWEIEAFTGMTPQCDKITLNHNVWFVQQPVLQKRRWSQTSKVCWFLACAAMLTSKLLLQVLARCPQRRVGAPMGTPILSATALGGRFPSCRLSSPHRSRLPVSSRNT